MEILRLSATTALFVALLAALAILPPAPYTHKPAYGAGMSMSAMSIDMDPSAAPPNTNPVRESSSLGQCTNDTDDDGDGWVNDGCLPFPPGHANQETPEQCSNSADDDGDTIVNDGCTARTGTLGTIQSCARINENDMLDADEEDVDTLLVEVTARNIPDASPMSGFRFKIVYGLWPELFNPTELLAANEGSSISFSDTYNAGSTVREVLDYGNGAHESGSGVLQKFYVSSLAESRAGEYSLSLRDAGHFDASGTFWNATSSIGAKVRVDSSCDRKVTMDAMSIDMDPAAAAANTNPVREYFEIGQCDNNTDDDGDGWVNDGCPRDPWGTPEVEGECANDINDDYDNEYYGYYDTLVNDGCTARSGALSTIQSCARINENDMLDADEDAVDTLAIDVTALNIPDHNGMTAYVFTVNYVDDLTTGLQMVGPTSEAELLNANAYSMVYRASDPLPDNTANWKWSGSALDVGASEPESGSGVLQKIRIASRPGTSPGLYPLTLSTHVHIDNQGGANYPDVTNHGMVAVWRPCQSPPGDVDGDGVTDAAESVCGSSAAHGGLRPERIDGPFAGVDDDLDGLIDEALPAAAAGADCDGDGFTGNDEAHVYAALTTGDQDPCGDAAPGWPADLVPEGLSYNQVTTQDLASFFAPVRYYNTNVGTNPNDVRWDLRPGKGAFAEDINLQDLTRIVFLKPPSLYSQQALNGSPCPWPP